MPVAAPELAKAAELDLAAVMAGLAAVPERRARFRETRRFAALDQPLESTGRLLYRRPATVEKITDWPIPERLLVEGDRLVLTEGQEPPRVVDLSAQPELRTLVAAIRGPLSGDLAALRQAFTVAAGGSMAGWSLDLTPRDPRAARFLRAVRVEGAGAEIRVLELMQGNGDAQRMVIDPQP